MEDASLRPVKKVLYLPSSLVRSLRDWTATDSQGKLIIGLPVAQSKNESCLCRNKTKWQTNLQEGDACPIPPYSGIDFWGRGGPCPFYHEFSNHWKPKWVGFFIVYTRFRRSYKLSVESIRPLQPNTRVVYATFLYCFTMPMQNETRKADKALRMVILWLIPKLIELRKRLVLESTSGVSHNQRFQTAYLSC